jgi:hypothetical protein
MRIAVIPGILLAFVACGGGSDNSAPTEARMNWTSGGIHSSANNTAITIPTGGRVHYFNQDSAPHQATSNCPELTEAAPLAPNGNELMPVIANATNCTITDALNPSNQTFQAFVNVQAPPPGAGAGGGGSGY